ASSRRSCLDTMRRPPHRGERAEVGMAVDPLTELRDVNTYFEGTPAPRDTGPTGGGHRRGCAPTVPRTLQHRAGDVSRPVGPDVDKDVPSVPVGEGTSRQRRGHR